MVFEMKIFWMEMNFRMKIFNILTLLGLFLPLAFGIGMIMPLRNADLYLWYDWLDID